MRLSFVKLPFGRSDSNSNASRTCGISKTLAIAKKQREPDLFTVITQCKLTVKTGLKQYLAASGNSAGHSPLGS